MYYILLGLIQGLTEFLPVSSSAHLALSQYILNIKIPGVAFEVFVHLCTSLSVIYLFRKEIRDIALSFIKSISKLHHLPTFINYIKDDSSSKFAWLLIISTLPGAIIGYLFQKTIEEMFNSPLIISLMLILTGFCLFLTDRYIDRGFKTIREINWVDAIFIGFAQAIAIMPGISRSGFTIMMALGRKLERKFAAEYSFILSIPIILGASLYKVKEIVQLDIDIAILLVSGVAAFISGCFAVKIFTKMLVNFKLRFFSYYLWIIATIIIIIYMGS